MLAALLLAAVVAEIARKGVLLKPDSRGYLSAAVHRTPAYPALIELLRRLVGRALLPTLVAVQSALGLGAVSLLALDLRRRFALGIPSSLAVLAVLLSPYWMERIGNFVLSQALAYPFFLLAVRFLLDGLLDRRDRDLALFFLFAALTVLARPQFLFLQAASLAVAAGVSWKRRPWRRNLPLVACLIASLLVVPLADRTWRWWRSGTFAGLPYTGQQLIAGAIYISEPGDENLFTGPTRELFVALRQHAAQKKLLSRGHQETPWRLLPGVSLPLFKMKDFSYTYNQLAWRDAYNLATASFCPACEPARAFPAIEPPLRRIALGVMRAHPGRWLLFYLSTLLAAAGPREWALLGLLFAAGVARARSAPDPAAIALLVGISLHVANLALVAAVEPELERYTFPTAVTALALIIVFLRSIAVPPVSAPRTG